MGKKATIWLDTEQPKLVSNLCCAEGKDCWVGARGEFAEAQSLLGERESKRLIPSLSITSTVSVLLMWT